ncbi:MAG TPA: hypothetical protein VJ276_23780 [Thermoanaerobaculia bacterium]|nr:hypothetical protein [Thermoanaerobaculia bacterium]
MLPETPSLFRFDMRDAVARLRNVARVDGVAIRLPGLSITVNVEDIERRVAREIVIRLADRRVLNSRECCDSCVSNALASLEKVRSFLVDKQVELADLTDGPLYVLISMMLEGIRQFLTYEERTKHHARRLSPEGGFDEDATFPAPGFFYRDRYRLALEQLRAHLYRTLEQIAAIADITIPTIPPEMRYLAGWPPDAYLVT